MTASSLPPAASKPHWQWDKILLIIAITAAIQAVTLYMMGRVPVCECGTIRLFVNEVNSNENSQQFFDWYTLSHIIHGFIFYGLFWLIAPKAPLHVRLLLALGLEIGWELVENSNFIIERYRANTSSVDYFGDSILNSVFDTLSMVLGFFLAARLPIWVIIVTAVFFEILALIVIRDNLILNVIMLLHPVDFIRQWQSGS
ncbi:DUF2585 domain-containing protein [Pseudochrobactrum algeriensis]|uniref:DUF2585 domain-containing protein n=1 Tax=Pseudochrobactrum algeriensis TaxID=2834768 RepID=UPI001BCBD36D|nr:DUF2585 domain-containing protein [Ochrobactrum sp. MR34]QVQ36785.1 DUF2585 domain-containing protein [Pseudochrobactrum algeriensis]QVQ40001.1 DUF2585 domain-containing protein [Pseudochrobactrum algeriensis]QVQ43924.1 DUF2585 domain-containing protein [Pseudochrobactrum algeriensis]